MIWLKLIIPVFRPKIDETTNYILNLNPDIIFSFYFRRLILMKIILKPRLVLIIFMVLYCLNIAVKRISIGLLVNGGLHWCHTSSHDERSHDEGDIVDQRGFDIAFTDTSLDVFIKV